MDLRKATCIVAEEYYLIPKWKIQFNVSGVKISCPWNNSTLFITPHKDQSISEVNGYFITECHEQDEAIERSREVIEKFMACYSIHIKTTKLRITYFPPYILNEKELKEKNIRIPTNIIEVEGLILDPSPNHDIEHSYTLFKNIDEHEKRDSLGITLRWYIRAIEYDEPYDKFIALWISFNSLYNIYYEGLSYRDADKIDYLATHLFNSNEAKNFLKKRRVENQVEYLSAIRGAYKSNSGRTDYSEELEQAYDNEQHIRALNYLIKCLYGIRKTIFHGDRDITKSDKKIVEDVNPVLAILVQDSILIYLKNSEEENA